jgi:hypothetical protein
MLPTVCQQKLPDRKRPPEILTAMMGNLSVMLES